MDLRDYIPQEEKQLLSDYISAYAYAGEATFASIDYRLRFWDSAKRPLFHLMGDQLILTKEINYEMTQEEIGQKITDAIDELDYDSDIVRLIDNFRHAMYSYYERAWNIGLALEDSAIQVNAYKYLMHFFDDESFGLNKVWGFNKPTTIIFKYGPHAEGNKPLEIKSDTKLMRALGKLVDWFELDKEAFEHLRIFVSQQTNDIRFKADCCLSIHPLDYLTMSDNCCEWDSCMNWTNGPGQYRLGTVEMMNSPVVIEAYVKSNYPYCPLDKREWSNKRWRCLYIVNKDIITEIKQYPYENTILSDFFMSWIKELAEKNMNWHYDNTVYKVKSNIENPIGDKTVFIRIKTNIMYNDYYYDHLAYINPDVNEIEINYSGETECMACGKSRYQDDFMDTDSVACNVCLGYTKCCDCGTYYCADDNEFVFDDEGNAYCDWCYEQHSIICGCCGKRKFKEYFQTSNEEPVRIVIPASNTKTEYNYPLTTAYICDECLEKCGVLREFLDHEDDNISYNDLYIDMVPEDMRQELEITDDMIEYGSQHFPRKLLKFKE